MLYLLEAEACASLCVLMQAYLLQYRLKMGMMIGTQPL